MDNKVLINMIHFALLQILGVAHGFNLLFGVNILASICFAAVASVLLPIFVDLLVIINLYPFCY